MYCYICGTEKNLVIHNSRNTCKECKKTTPKKVSRESFDKAYWRGSRDVPESTKREFYSDYMASQDTLAAYIESTTSKTDY